MRRAVVLLSGGLDSATVLAIASHAGFECYTLAFQYGQRHAVELVAAGQVAAALKARVHHVASVNLSWIGGSALTDMTEDVPKDRSVARMTDSIPRTYVPARNTIFLSNALGWAEALGAADIFAGMNVLDYSGYPDCRPEYLAAFQTMARLGTRAGNVTVHAPLIKMTKAEIIREGTRLGVNYAMTHSCYDPKGDLACARCDACILRAKGFHEAGVSDPTRYA